MVFKWCFNVFILVVAGFSLDVIVFYWLFAGFLVLVDSNSSKRISSQGFYESVSS